MKLNSFSISNSLCILCAAILISVSGCSPKYIVKGDQVRGQILDAATRQPIEDAAVTIRWMEEPPDQMGSSRTFRVLQTLTDQNGFFEVPQYPSKSYVMGIYKAGYVCWSSRDIFPMGNDQAGPVEYQKRKDQVVEDGMQIELQPFGKQYSRHQHAGFTVMVAGEAGDASRGPFQTAVEPEFRRWRDSLRKDFHKKFGSGVAAKDQVIKE